MEQMDWTLYTSWHFWRTTPIFIYQGLIINEAIGCIHIGLFSNVVSLENPLSLTFWMVMVACSYRTTPLNHLRLPLWIFNPGHAKSQSLKWIWIESVLNCTSFKLKRYYICCVCFLGSGEDKGSLAFWDFFVILNTCLAIFIVQHYCDRQSWTVIAV